MASDCPQTMPEKQEPLVTHDPPNQERGSAEEPIPETQETRGKEPSRDDPGNPPFSGFHASSWRTQETEMRTTHSNHSPEAAPTFSNLRQVVTPLNPRISLAKLLSPVPLLSFDPACGDARTPSSPPPPSESPLEFAHCFQDHSCSLAASQNVLVTPSLLVSYADKTKSPPPTVDRDMAKVFTIIDQPPLKPISAGKSLGHLIPDKLALILIPLQTGASYLEPALVLHKLQALHASCPTSRTYD